MDTGIVSNGQNLFSLEYSISEYDSNSWNVIMSTCNSLSETLIGSIKDELGVKLFDGPVNKLDGDFNKHILKYDNGYRFDGNLIESGNKYTNENYLLFGSDKYEYGCKGRIYDLLFYKNYFLVGTKEIMHLIPVMKRSNNEVGMLDIYNNKLIFYPNIGTGEFIAGPQKELELRSYDNPISIEVGKSNMKFTAYFKKRYRKILIGE